MKGTPRAKIAYTIRRLRPTQMLVGVSVRMPAADRAVHWPWVGGWGLYELDTELFFRAVLRPGDLAGDVGANEGILTTVAAKLVGPSGTVIACGPDPAPREVLRRAVARNRLVNVEIVPKAIGAHGTTVESVVGGRKPRLVKIDVDGPELDVLGGMSPVLGDRPYLVIELADAKTAPVILDMVRTLGYQTYASRMKFARVLPVERITDLRALPVRFERREVANLFCSPEPIDIDTVWPPRYLPPA